MAHLLITSGPTRQYLDPVRYLTNASSGRMGQALSEAALEAGHRVTIVTGPVDVRYPSEAEVIEVITTDEMLSAAQSSFKTCDGAIGVAAPCDYRPRQVAAQKLAKTGQPLLVELIETPDIIGALGRAKRASQWVVAFALETADHHRRALRKLKRKSCDLIVVNSASAMDAVDTHIEVLDRTGQILLAAQGPKRQVAKQLFATIEQHLIS